MGGVGWVGWGSCTPLAWGDGLILSWSLSDHYRMLIIIFHHVVDMSIRYNTMDTSASETADILKFTNILR